MSNSNNRSYQFIDTPAQLETFYQENKEVPWLCFDTEFVGEKRYWPRLCLIQVATEKGNYLIDPFQCGKLDLFLALMEDAKICKITHAGDNDYRLLNNLFGTVPKNVFDTQIAAGFLGYRYPISFRKLVETELGWHLKKGYAVADWEARPFQQRQLNYALEDVLPLYRLWRKASERLKRYKREAWAKEEFQKLETASYYEKSPYHEAVNSNMIKSLANKEKLFFLRLTKWRVETAEKRNHSKEMVLPSKMINHIVRNVGAGKDALKKNRRIPDKVTDKLGDVFVQLYQLEESEEERSMLAKIPDFDKGDDQNEDIIIDLLYLLIKYKCIEDKVATSLVCSKNQLLRFKLDRTYREAAIGHGWRRIFLGDDMASWLDNMEDLKLEINGGKIEIKVTDEK